MRDVDAALDDDAVLSIQLAVAQWLRSPRATSAARERLRARGVSEDEIQRRRRCESTDARLGAILRLAVTLLIARGRLNDRETRLLGPAKDERTLRAISAAVAQTYYDVSVAESIERPPYVPIEMNVGDY